jgi:hypothetical protein
MRYEDRGCTVRAAALRFPVLRLLVPGLVAMAAWWYWTGTASAETAGTVDAPSADAGPVAQAVDLAAPVAALSDTVDGVGRLLGIEPVTDLVVGEVDALTPVVRDVTEDLQDLTQLPASAPDATAGEPTAEPTPVPTKPASKPRRQPALPHALRSAAATATAPTNARARDERAWARRPTSAPSVGAPTPAAGRPAPEAEAPAPARPPRQQRPSTPQSASVPGSETAGHRSDRGPQLAGTPGAHAALVAATTAARFSAAVAALEDGPGTRPPITPD